MDTLVRLERAGGHGDGERWRRQRSGALGEERTREEGEREGGEKDRGGCVATCGPSRAARGGQAGREGGGVARWRARAPGTLRSPVGKEDDRGGEPGGLGHLLAGPACCGWAAQGKPQVSPSFFYFCFSIFFLTFVLI